MAENSSIEWTDHTANLWWGCTEVHAGCDNCYAREYARNRAGKEAWGNDRPRYAVKSVWKNLRVWQEEAREYRAATGRPRRVFVGSMMDIAEKATELVTWKGGPHPETMDSLRRRFFEEVVPASPDLQFLLLSKRPSMFGKVVPPSWLEADGWPPNVLTGTSPVDQPTADTLVPQLLRLPGRHFLSMEPLLGPVDLRAVPIVQKYEDGCSSITGPFSGWTVGTLDWIIVGGESGGKARPMHPDWARFLRDQAAEHGVPFMFKQWGRWVPPRQGVRCGREPMTALDNRTAMYAVGKKRAGRRLDGKTHDGFPANLSPEPWHPS